MPHKPHLREAIVRTLEDFGPLSAQEIADTAGLKKTRVSICISQTRQVVPGLIRIAGWRRQEGKGGRAAPLYDLGSEPDVPLALPPATVRKRVYNRQYRARNRARLQLLRYASKGGEITPFTALVLAVG